MSVFPGSFWKEVLSRGASLGTPKRMSCGDTAYKMPQAKTSLFTAPLLHGARRPFALALFQLTFHHPSVLVFLWVSKHWLSLFPVAQGALGPPRKSVDMCPQLIRKTNGGEGCGHNWDPLSILNSIKNRKALSGVLAFGLISSRWSRDVTWHSQLTVIGRDGAPETQCHSNVLFEWDLQLIQYNCSGSAFLQGTLLETSH